MQAFGVVAVAMTCAKKSIILANSSDYFIVSDEIEALPHYQIKSLGCYAKTVYLVPAES
jgi:hypothetical protein